MQNFPLFLNVSGLSVILTSLMGAEHRILDRSLIMRGVVLLKPDSIRMIHPAWCIFKESGAFWTDLTMDKPGEQNLADLFDHVQELAQEARIPFLEELRLHDAQKARALDELLAEFAHFDAALEGGNDLESDSLMGDSSRDFQTNIGEKEDQQIGPYQLIEKIGEGGMGVVYLARHSKLERPVALKILSRSGFRGLVNKEYLKRFQEECRVQALMNHPHIARLYEAGVTEEGHPWFSMEYVPGLPVTHYCRQENLDLRARLSLFLELCDGVIHAHQKAVIHRDLKPGNILVSMDEGRPVAKIIDFGIARPLDLELRGQDLHTRTGSLLGTPAYMSPEQLSSQPADTRVDVYALGVILYELLAGARPFNHQDLEKKPFDEMLRIYREQEPVSPSTRLGEVVPKEAQQARKLKGDLDLIAMKAMAKDIHRRYQTVEGLKRDVQYFLDHKPIQARPPGPAYRFQKFVQRHKALASAILSTFLALMIGLAIAVNSSVKAHKARADAETAERETREALSKLQVGNTFLRDMLSAPNPRMGARDTRIVDVLSRAASQVENHFQGDDHQESQIRLILGTTYLGLGLYESAEHQLLTTYQIQERIYGSQHQEPLRTLYYLGQVHLKLRDYELAGNYYQQALNHQKRFLPEDHGDVLASMEGLATSLMYLKDFTRSDTLFQEALARRVAGKSDLAETARIMAAMAQSQNMQRDHQKAEDLYREALNLLKGGPREIHPETLAIQHNLALCLHLQRKYGDAESLFRKILDWRSSVLGVDHPLTNSTRYGLAQSLYRLERYDEAAYLLSFMLNREMAYHRPGPALPNYANLLARILDSRGRGEDAIAVLTGLLDFYRDLDQPPPPSLTSVVNNLGHFLSSQNRWLEARQHLEASLAMSQVNRDNPKIYITLGEIYKGVGMEDEASAAYCRAWEEALEQGVFVGRMERHYFQYLENTRR